MTETRSRISEDLHTSIERELASRFADRTKAAAGYGQEFATLWTHASDHVLGGKLVRPILLVDAYDALRETADAGHASGGAEEPARSTVIELAAAIEMLHFSFLLHDDVIDGDVFRRRRTNLIGTLRDEHPENGAESGAALHWGRTGGILMGDLLLAATHQIFARADLPTATRLRLLDLLDHTVTESVAGEQADVGLSDGVIAPDLHRILAMTAHKTATYTFELPLRAAAILAGASAATESAMSSAGRHLGLAFQLQDDLLSSFGDHEAHGKDPHSDLREGKQTAIIAYARMTSAWPSIETSFGDPALGTADALRVRDLLIDCGAEQFARNLVTEQVAALYEILAASAIPRPVRHVLLDMATGLEGRTS